MAYIVLQDFKAGVDRRRPIHSGEPGSLWEGINCHLTRGGDAEKRKKFVSKYTLPANQTFGLAATEAALYTFGSAAAPAVPAGMTYMRLQHPDGLTMTDVLAVELFDGKLYVVAKFDNAYVAHFYDGAFVADWYSGIVRAGMVDNSGIASHLASLIQADTTYSTSVLANVITITAVVAGTPFTLETTTENVEGGVDDQTAVVALVTPNVAPVAETLSTVSFQVTAGTNNAGVNTLATLTIGGVDVLGGAVDWVTSNAVTAANIAAAINTTVSAPEYTATSSGQTVTISGAVGSGDTPNGLSVVIDPAGDVAIDGAAAAAPVNKNMGIGVDAVAGQAQVSTVTIGGTFEIGDRFTVDVDDKHFGADGNPRVVGTLAHTQVNKVWSAAGSLVPFSGVATPTGLNADEDAGAGSINAATHAGGSSTVTGLETYQGRLAIFSRRTVQIWVVDEDEELNHIEQTLKNTGTVSPDSVIAFSDVDVIFLDRYGIRSLRARDSSNAATVAGIGALIDKYVVPYVRTLTDGQVESAVSAIDPEEGRLWMAVGTKIFVFSYFPETKISGWTWYEPGFEVDYFADFENRMYARSGDTVYLYGGDDNAQYDPATDAQGKVTCWIPFISVQKDGTYKRLSGIDIASENSWDAVLLVDPNDLSRVSEAARLSGVTFSLDDTPVIGQVTHMSPKLTCQQDGPASLSKIAIYYEKGEDSDHG